MNQQDLLKVLGLGEYRRNIALTLANYKRSETPSQVVERAKAYEAYMDGRQDEPSDEETCFGCDCSRDYDCGCGIGWEWEDSWVVGC